MEYSIEFEHQNGVFNKYLNNFEMKTFKAFSKHITDVIKLKTDVNDFKRKKEKKKEKKNS
jgi:hypothetical protein